MCRPVPSAGKVTVSRPETYSQAAKPQGQYNAETFLLSQAELAQLSSLADCAKLVA